MIIVTMMSHNPTSYEPCTQSLLRVSVKQSCFSPFLKLVIDMSVERPADVITSHCCTPICFTCSFPLYDDVHASESLRLAR